MSYVGQISRAYHFDNRESAERIAKEYDGGVVGHEGMFVIYLGFGAYLSF